MKTKILNSDLSVTINHKGAELISISSNSSKREYIWEGNPNYWGKHSPILFPIVGALKNDCYLFENTVYHLHRHGFARDLEFTLIDHQPDQAVFLLKSNEITHKNYPFDFELYVIYSLKKTELNVRYRVVNADSKRMPFSIGGHPAFALLDTFENYSLEFVAGDELICYPLKNNLIGNESKKIELYNNALPLSYDLFEKDALIFKSFRSKQIQIKHLEKPFLKFKFDDFPNFGIWTLPQAPFICLEPWVGYADTESNSGNILEKEGIQVLEAFQIKEFTFSIEILQ